MSIFSDNLRTARIAKNLTQDQLAERVEASSGKVVYTWEKGTGKPDTEKLTKICEVLGVSADYLLGVKTERFEPTIPEIETIKKYRSLDSHGKTVVDYIINTEYDRSIALSKKKKPQSRLIKLDWFLEPVSAGTGMFLDSSTKEEILVKDTPEAEEADFVLSVSGDSMEPEFHDGDKVLVCYQDTIEIGEIGIFVINNDAYIKELGKGKLLSLNPKYKPILFRNDDSVYCCGKVLGIAEE